MAEETLSIIHSGEPAGWGRASRLALTCSRTGVPRAGRYAAPSGRTVELGAARDAAVRATVFISRQAYASVGNNAIAC